MPTYPKEDLYAILGVSDSATEAEIKKAYRKKIKEYHSDKPDSWERIKAKFPRKSGETDTAYNARMKKQIDHVNVVINQAKDVLLNPSERREYDFWRSQNKRSNSQNSSNNSGSGSSSRSSKSHANNQQQNKTYQDGRVYSGHMNARGKPHGQGKMVWPDGRVYDGQWNRGRMDGQGTMTFADGVYEGQWSKDDVHGQGKFSWVNGESYEGAFNHGAMTGHGTYTWPDGRMYVGEFVDGNCHGQGTMTWPNGQEYEGQWYNDQQHGQGTMRYPDGSVETGAWSNGGFQGNAAGASSAPPPYGGAHSSDPVDYTVRPFILKSLKGFLTTEYGIKEHAFGEKTIYVRKNILGGFNNPPPLDFNRLSSVGSSGVFTGNVDFQTTSGTTDIQWKNVWRPSMHAANVDKIRNGQDVSKPKMSANLATIFAGAALSILMYAKTIDFSSSSSEGDNNQIEVVDTPSNEKKEGWGVTIPDGYVLLNDFSNMQLASFTGKGVLVTDYILPRVYTGDWVEGKKSGYGSEKTYLDSGVLLSEYEGWWKNNKEYGHGVEIKYLTHDGSVAYKYKGGFVEGKESGMGVQTHYNRDGSVQYKHDGVWENGKFKGIKIPNTHFLKTETQDERRKYYDSLYPGLKKIKLPPTPEL